MIDRDALRDFYDDYYNVLDDVRLEEWPALFTEDCMYRVIPRENFEAGYTLSTIYAESRGMLVDRVMGMTRTQMFAPRYYRRFPGPLRIDRAGGRRGSGPAQSAGRADADRQEERDRAVGGVPRCGRIG